MAIDLFADIGKPDSELHPQFVGTRDAAGYAPARHLIRALQQNFADPDGNFVQQFQTFGFDARTFEFFLSVMFAEAGHNLDRSHGRPDFLIVKDGLTAAVEAVTANPPPTKIIQPYQALGVAQPEAEMMQTLEHILPIRLGSPLFSKLKKKYWELAHVEGRPLVLAIEDFHTSGSLSTSSTPLTNYLYGLGQRWWHDEAGNLVIEHNDVSTHKHGDKEIPSGFFRQEGAENISAVLFCNSGTIAKFNRMGHQGDYKTRGVRMLRWGICYRHDPNAVMPEPFVYEVGAPGDHVETWSEGTVLIHNPGAVHPLPQGWLGASIEQSLSANQITTLALERFLPYMSMTNVLVNASRGDVRKQAELIFRILLEGDSQARPIAAKFGRR